MAKKPKVKGPESVGFKEIFGVTAIATNDGFAAIFMSTMFMVFMTDYAGLGSWGATLATVLLLVARIIDAVDDPIQGFWYGSAIASYGYGLVVWPYFLSGKWEQRKMRA